MRAVKTNYAVVMVWGLTIFIYLAFIALLSALYPYGFDEYQGLSDSLKSAFKIFWHTHTSFQPRIGGLFGSIILYLGKWSFVLLNPLAQISLVFSYFYFIFLRTPDFKALKDLSVFLLLCLLSFLAVPIPAETVFWIGGANNYSWTMLIFMIMLCALRAAAEGKDFIGKKRFNLFIFAVVGLFLGMSNENNAPMALVIFALSFAYFKIKKIQIPKWYYFALLGIIVGLIILFFSGGTLKRAADWNFEYFFKASVLTKIFFHLSNMHDYFTAVLLPLITPILIFLVFVDSGGGGGISDKNFIMSVLCCVCSIILATVLFLAPSVGSLRVFYSSAVFSILAFVFIINLIKDVYKVDLFRYLSAAGLIFFFAITPSLVFPYIDLYVKSSKRIKILQLAKTSTAKAEQLKIIAGPYPNLTIMYYDGIYSYKFAPANKIKAKIELPKVNRLRHLACEVI